MSRFIAAQESLFQLLENHQSSPLHAYALSLWKKDYISVFPAKELSTNRNQRYFTRGQHVFFSAARGSSSLAGPEPKRMSNKGELIPKPASGILKWWWRWAFRSGARAPRALPWCMQ